MMFHTHMNGAEGEMRVMLELTRRGFRVSRPMMDGASYDMIADSGDHLCRIQVKATRSEERPGRYIMNMGSRGAYSKGDFDFLIIYIQPRDAFCIIPASEVVGLTGVTLSFWTKSGKENRFWEYLNNWEILHERENSKVVGSSECGCCRCPLPTLQSESCPA